MSQKSANSCIRPDCTVKMVRYACSKCNTARYCSIRCQIDDWQRHKCIGDPLGVSGDQPLFDLVAQITSDALSFQRAHFHIRRDNTKLTPTERVGLVGRGADSAVLAVVSKHLAGTQKQTSYALKISISDGRAGLFAVAGQMDILVHRALQNSYASSVTPLPKLHADWIVFSSLRNYFAHFDVRHYEGSQSQRDDRVIINEILRTAPPGVAPDAIVSMPVHMSCALMEMLTITVAGVVSRYLTDEDAAPRMPALINNVCMNVVASLATLRSSRVTHNDLHTGNVYIANFPAEIKSVDYRIGDGYYSVPTMHPGFKGMFIQQTRVVIADFGRVAMGITNTDLGVWLSGWPRDKDAMALMNWPNYDNPGYDMWLFACDLIKLYGGRVPLPSMLAHMVPGSAQIEALRDALARHPARNELLEPFRLVSEAVQNHEGAAIRAAQLLRSQDAQNRYVWRTPWLPRFFRTPEQILSSVVEPALLQRRATRSLGSELIQSRP